MYLYQIVMSLKRNRTLDNKLKIKYQPQEHSQSADLNQGCSSPHIWLDWEIIGKIIW